MSEAKPFAAFDVDGTIFKSSLLEKVVQALIDADLFPEEPFNEVYRSRNRWQHNNNEGLYHAYLDRLVETFIQRIGGIQVEQFNTVANDMLTEHAVRKFSFPRKLIRATQDSHFIVALSGSPLVIVEPFLADLPIDQISGSSFPMVEGIFTGEAVSAPDKGELLDVLEDQGKIKKIGSIAVGDTINDKSMLRRASNPIMFNASHTLTNYGNEYGWTRVNEIKDQVTVMRLDNESKVYYEEDLEDYLEELRQAPQKSI